ncbi:SDR family NAD(P)-dependent oxidoreductase [Ammoniphilus sp. 3BR4]|uniref:SDR family NAD(P)-dependent oxidoreductase n=1 Tax=Ammoniphilus sp. 3BR4 TaxID=3158265 RepID=UPI0034679EF7
MKYESAKIIIISGANGGIGLEIAKAFLRENSIVILPVHIKAGNIQKLLDIYGENRVHVMQLDQRDLTSIDSFIETVDNQFGRVNVLVNNAGIVRLTSLADMSENVWNDTLETNVKGPFLLSQKVLPLMKKAGGGSIVNISSISGHEPTPGLGAYSTSKAGMIMLTRQMAIEWAPYNIRVNAVSPGLIRTPLTEDLYKNEQIHQRRRELIPLKQIGTGEQIADIVCFLCSSKSSYITGQSIVADGGLMGSVQAHIPR